RPLAGQRRAALEPRRHPTSLTPQRRLALGGEPHRASLLCPARCPCRFARGALLGGGGGVEVADGRRSRARVGVADGAGPAEFADAVDDLGRARARQRESPPQATRSTPRRRTSATTAWNAVRCRARRRRPNAALRRHRLAYDADPL